MAEDRVYVRFQPGETRAAIPRGATIRDASAQAGIVLDLPCGGQGNCGKCKVRARGELASLTGAEKALLSHEERLEGVRLACQAAVLGSVAVEVPETTLLASTYKILTDSAVTREGFTDPPVRAIPVRLNPPSLGDDVSDLERLQRDLGSLHVDLQIARRLPPLLRASGYRGTAILSGDRLLAFVPGDTPPRCLVAAVDVGTTTLAAILLDTAGGVELARTSRLNPQTAYGDDVLSRISYAGAGPAQLDRMRQEVIGAVNAMLDRLAAEAGVTSGDIYAVVFAGNTIMQHLLLGIDPAPIGVVPFAPAISAPLDVAARAAGLDVHPEARCYVFPSIAGYVGGDAVAGILASGLCNVEAPALFLDIGTNGELVLSTEGRLVATSCAAGPAFEGVRIKHGMRAAAGAIEAIHIEDDVAFKVIGGSQPIGMCGSGLIDLVAELLRLGVIVWTGDLLGPDTAPSGLPDAVAARLQCIGGEPAFLVAGAGETQTGQPIVLYQSDVREVQLAAAAVRAAIQILLDRTATRIGDLKHLLVAGGFGNYIRCENAQRMGLLPSDLEPARIAFVGNTSLSGARLAAMSRGARHEAEYLAQCAEHIDLSLDPAFQEIYVEALFFPHPAD